jgi:hypothetical protein
MYTKEVSVVITKLYHPLWDPYTKEYPVYANNAGIATYDT